MSAVFTFGFEAESIMRDCIPRCIRLSALILETLHDLSLPAVSVCMRHNSGTLFAAFMRFNVSPFTSRCVWRNNAVRPFHFATQISKNGESTSHFT